MDAEGTGAAFDASVSVADLEAALLAARRRRLEEAPLRAIEAAEKKVEKQRMHLAAAEAELARLREG